MRRWIFYFAGLFIAALGISSIIVADVGAGAWDTVFVGLTYNFGLTPGTWNIIVGGCIMLLNAFLSKKKPDLPAFLTVFTLGLFIDFYLFVYRFIDISNIGERIILFLVGFILLSTGAGMYLQAKFAPNPIDSLMLVVQKKTGFSLAISRLICETFALLSGLLLSGPVSYGTAFVAFSIGPCLQFSCRKMEQLYNATSISAKKDTAI